MLLGVATILIGALLTLSSAYLTNIPKQCFAAKVTEFGTNPVLSHLQGSSTFSEVFNPSWIQASEGTNGKAGLLVRSQNCSGYGPGDCAACSGTGQNASYLAFAELLNNDNVSTPEFASVDRDSIVFGPHDATDDKGTEDPRVAFDPTTGIYYLMYTCYNSGKAVNQSAVTLCLATSPNPASPDSWTRHGPVGFGQDSKSAALLIREVGPHFLYWGAGTIHMTSSSSLTHWPSPGSPFITKTLWGNPNVESGPPPMKLSTGDYVFFHNSWNAEWPKQESPGYQPAWVVLNGSDPTQIIARAPGPLWSPSRAKWMEGKAPFACNMPTVAFLEAAHPTEQPDHFRVYFGGSDAVVGSAVVSVTTTDYACNGSMP